MRGDTRAGEGGEGRGGEGYREGGYCGGVAAADGDGGSAGRERGSGRAAERHITNAIPDPHGSARIALLFGFN
jgi:hypothetical protein